MNKINYDILMQKEIEKLKGEKPKLLLHACCAPCSSVCIERLKPYFDITVYFFNPNIDDQKEYCLRGEEQRRFSEATGVDFILCPHDSDKFFETVKGYEREKEGGARCDKCFRLRLYETAKTAKKENFDYFATTLTLSPLKNEQLLNRIGEEIEKEIGIKYLFSDFKKRGGYQRSIELSKEYNLYRQNYCGCVYSKKIQE
jgi:predicted adenine nucleotide alpha hydrolase (AANH) superfamily ATPase